MLVIIGILPWCKLFIHNLSDLRLTWHLWTTAENSFLHILQLRWLTQWASFSCEDGEPTAMTSLPRVLWPGDKPLTTLQKLLGDVTKFTFTSTSTGAHHPIWKVPYWFSQQNLSWCAWVASYWNWQGVHKAAAVSIPKYACQLAIMQAS